MRIFKHNSVGSVYGRLSQNFSGSVYLVNAVYAVLNTGHVYVAHTVRGEIIGRKSR